MPGFDRKRVVGLSEQDLNEFTCGICRGIFDNPVVTNCCQLLYCSQCINEWFIKYNTYPSPKVITNLLANMKVKCDFHINGCQTVVRMKELTKHSTNCDFRPNIVCNICETTCTPNNGHNCIESLKHRIKSMTNDNSSLRTANKTLYTENNRLRNESTKLTEKLQLMSLSSSDKRKNFGSNSDIKVKALESTNEKSINTGITVTTESNDSNSDHLFIPLSNEKPAKSISALISDNDISKIATNSSRNESNIERETQEILGKVKTVLYKLMPQNIDDSVKQILCLRIDTEERLKSVLDVIYETALDRQESIAIFAQLCKGLSNIKFNIDDNSDEVKFQKLLLSKCQKEFEEDVYGFITDSKKRQEEIDKCADPQKKKFLSEELDEDMRRVHKRSLGNIKLIGELYKLNILRTNTMFQCIEGLIRDADDLSFECLCALFKTISQQIETEASNAVNVKQNYISILDNFFNKKDNTVDRNDTAIESETNNPNNQLSSNGMSANSAITKVTTESSNSIADNLFNQLSNEKPAKSECTQKSYIWYRSSTIATNSSDNEVVEEIKIILNQLMPKNLEKSVKKIECQRIDTEERLQCVVDLIHEKAVDREDSCALFAQLCFQLSTLKVTLSGNSRIERLTFRNLLRTKCLNAQEFHKMKRISQKERLANIKLIGEIFKIESNRSKVFGIHLIFHFIHQMITVATNESLECLCTLLMTCCQEIQTKAKRKSSQRRGYESVLENFLAKMYDIVNGKDPKAKHISNRIRHLLTV